MVTAAIHKIGLEHNDTAAQRDLIFSHARVHLSSEFIQVNTATLQKYQQMIDHIPCFVAQVIDLTCRSAITLDILRCKRSLVSFFDELLQKVIKVACKEAVRIAFRASRATRMDRMRKRLERGTHLAFWLVALGEVGLFHVCSL